MSQQLEIEYKCLINKQQYDHLINYFKVNENELIKQKNIYLDTKDFILKKHHLALRVRIKDSIIELTLKAPATIGLIETTDIITEDELNVILNTGKLPNYFVLSELTKYNIDNEFIHTASLTTIRYESKYCDCLLALDQSEYYGRIDYELELEVNELVKGKQIFFDLLNKFNITYQKAENKIARANKFKQIVLANK